MRHLLGEALQKELLAGGVVPPAHFCGLVAASSAAKALHAGATRAGAWAVPISPVASATQANLTAAAEAVVEAVCDRSCGPRDPNG